MKDLRIFRCVGEVNRTLRRSLLTARYLPTHKTYKTVVELNERLGEYMERVTKRIDGKHACYQICEKDCPDGITKDNPACVCSASRQAMEKLLHYEDLEEQGRLLELPCTVGDTVYEVQSVRKRVQPLEIVSVYLGRMKELFFNWELKDGFGIYKNTKGFGLSELGKTVFLTKEEAEQQLEKLNLGFSGGVRC